MARAELVLDARRLGALACSALAKNPHPHAQQASPSPCPRTSAGRAHEDHADALLRGVCDANLALEPALKLGNALLEARDGALELVDGRIGEGSHDVCGGRDGCVGGAQLQSRKESRWRAGGRAHELARQASPASAARECEWSLPEVASRSDVRLPTALGNVWCAAPIIVTSNEITSNI
jgi:hypothetical protein